MNRTVLSYKESLLRESDVELLRGPYWLNDTLISFYFEYLEHERFKGVSALLFVPPDVTQCIKMAPLSETHVFLQPLLGETERDFVFFALNDNVVTEASGGSHWSLLVFSKPERLMIHVDSSRGTNEEQAIELSQKVCRYLALPFHGRYLEASCLQQNNGYDCGIHLICNAEQLASYGCHYGRIQGCPKVAVETVQNKRAELLEIIESLRSRRSSR